MAVMNDDRYLSAIQKKDLVQSDFTFQATDGLGLAAPLLRGAIHQRDFRADQ